MSLQRTEIVLPAASIGQENPLPPLVSLQDSHEVENRDELPAEMAEAISYGRLPSTLPYLLQDGYDRERVPRALPALVLENERLRATVLPGLGGRLHSLWHKESGRELLFSNPVLQPANLALRNAWFAGGVEWNLGSIGHTTLTCAPMHAAAVVGPDGSAVLRLWEWERTRDLPYQVDFWLPAGSEFLFVGVRIRNPHDHDVPAYWWSTAAVEQHPDTRVVVPAGEAWHFGYTRRLERVPVPHHRGFDVSYPVRHRQAADYFFELPPGRRRWIAAVRGDGHGVVQTSTDRLRGRKLFVWGVGAGGRRWQEWLSPDSGSPGYLEIQAGLARTQLEHLRLPARTAWDWLEAYGPITTEPAASGGSASEAWADAVGGVERALGVALPADEMDARFTAWQGIADAEPGDRLHRGSGWGALEAARLARAGRSLTLPGTPFESTDLGPEQQPWLALLDGAMPETPPGGTLVSASWRALLDSAEESWLTCYHRGIARWYEGGRDGAVAAWRRSVELKETPWALRNLAAARRDAGAHAEAADLLDAALRLAPEVTALAIEAIGAALEAGRVEQAALLLDRARAHADHGRFALLDARIRLAHGDLDGARRVFDDGFEVADLREGERTLSETWAAIQDRAGTADPLPAAYDFRMVAD